jgi:hypothetical protein
MTAFFRPLSGQFGKNFFLVVRKRLSAAAHDRRKRTFHLAKFPTIAVAAAESTGDCGAGSLKQ